jgi:hypothetical protein
VRNRSHIGSGTMRTGQELHSVESDEARISVVLHTICTAPLATIHSWALHLSDISARTALHRHLSTDISVPTSLYTHLYIGERNVSELSVYFFGRPPRGPRPHPDGPRPPGAGPWARRRRTVGPCGGSCCGRVAPPPGGWGPVTLFQIRDRHFSLGKSQHSVIFRVTTHFSGMSLFPREK